MKPIFLNISKGEKGSDHCFRYASSIARKSAEKKESNPEWLEVSNMDDGSAEIKIYGTISPFAWYEDEVSASDIYNQLRDIKSKVIHVRINSGGGSVFDGVSIYNLLKEKDARIVSHIDGNAASIASIIALAGDEVIISEAASFMIHDPSTGIFGNAEEMRKVADTLDTLKKGLVAVYVRATGESEDVIAKWMEEEKWFSGKEAVEIGFADKLTEDQEPINDQKFSNEDKKSKLEQKTALNVMLKRTALNELIHNTNT